MSRKKNAFFTYSDDSFYNVGNAESDEEKTPNRMSIFEVVSKDRELTEISASTTMTALDAASIIDGQVNTQHNVDQTMTAISTVSKQLSENGGSFVGLQTRIAKLEALLNLDLKNAGIVLKNDCLHKKLSSEHGEVSSKFVNSDYQNGSATAKASKIRYIHYKLRKRILLIYQNLKNT